MPATPRAHLLAELVRFRGPWAKTVTCTGGLATAVDGRLVVADSASEQVWVVDAGLTAEPLFAVRSPKGKDAAEPGRISLMGPTDVSIDADGTICVADGMYRVLALDPSGEVRLLVGLSGDYFDSSLPMGPEGWAAEQIQLWNPAALAVLPDGSVLVGCAAGDLPNHYVVRVTNEQRVFAAAGNGIKGSTGDGGPATAAKIYRVQGLAAAPDGGFYVSSGFNTVRRVDREGIIHAFAGGRRGYSGDGGPSLDARLAQPHGIACGSDGSVYIADTDNGCIRRVGPSGEIETLLGAGHGLIRKADGRLGHLRLRHPVGLAFDPHGRLLITDDGRLLAVDLSSSFSVPATSIRLQADDGGAVEDGPEADWTFSRPRRMLLSPVLDHSVLGDVLEMVYTQPERDDRTAVQGDPGDDIFLWYQGSRGVEIHGRGWQQSDQEAFDDLWGEDALLLMTGAVDELQWQWPEALESAVRRHLPTVWEGIERLAFRPDFWSQGTFAPRRRVPFEERERLSGFEDRCRTTLRVGALHAHLRQGTIPSPSRHPVACPLCGEGFLQVSTHRLTFKHWGAPRYCNACSMMAYGGYSPVRDQETIADSLRRFSNVLGWVPASDFRHLKMPPALDHSVRDQAMAELVVVPDQSVIRKVFGKSWLGVLQRLGLVGEAWRPAYGTYCLAADGHPCRSLFERQIDDWLHANDVEHQVEPTWPRHPTFNPSGRQRADWRLGDGTYVEAAGMMERPDYAAKIAIKVQLAAATGVRLIVIEPSDLGMLHVLLAAPAGDGAGRAST